MASRQCRFFSNGHCKYGNRCAYLHGDPGYYAADSRRSRDVQVYAENDNYYDYGSGQMYEDGGIYDEQEQAAFSGAHGVYKSNKQYYGDEYGRQQQQQRHHHQQQQQQQRHHHQQKGNRYGNQQHWDQGMSSFPKHKADQYKWQSPILKPIDNVSASVEHARREQHPSMDTDMQQAHYTGESFARVARVNSPRSVAGSQLSHGRHNDNNMDVHGSPPATDQSHLSYKFRSPLTIKSQWPEERTSPQGRVVSLQPKHTQQQQKFSGVHDEMDEGVDNASPPRSPGRTVTVHNNSTRRKSENAEKVTTSRKSEKSALQTTAYYTPVTELTNAQRDAFQANSFSLGSVPEIAPPLELC